MKCPMIKKCGGCFYPQDQYQEELKEKTLFIEKEIKKAKLKIEVKPTVASPLENGYRNKAIVAFNQKYEYGLYEEHSQDIIPYKHCLLHEDIMDEILQYIQSYLRKYRVSIYDRKRHKGLLRHVLIRRAVKTDQTMVVLVCNENMWRGSKQFCSQLVKKFPSIKTIVLNVNTRKTPIVLGNEDKVLYGKGFIVDELCGLKFKISPQSFYQINHDQCVNLYTKAISLLNIKVNETAIDAYCGIGTIGMILSQKVKQVIGVESNRDAIKDAKNNARMNQLSNIQFICDDATEFMKKLAQERHKVDVVIMDPPRSGSTKQFMDSVKILNPKQVVYISCDPTTQIRNIQYFKKIGYHTNTMYLYDMFPHTRHVETVVLLSHKKPDGHINVKVEFGEGEGKVPLDNIAKRAEEYKPKERVTYKMIKEYIEAKYGFKVHTAYIAEVKRDLGLPMYDAPNAVEELKQPRKHPTAEKVEAIKDALKHFEVI